MGEPIGRLGPVEVDMGERNNLAENYPEKVEELKQLMEKLSKGEWEPFGPVR